MFNLIHFAFFRQMLSQLLTSIQTADKTEKVLIVSNFTSVLDSIERVVQSLQLDFFRLDGKIKQSKRQQMVDSFNRPSDPRNVFLLSSKAGGVGLNLIGASRLIMMDCDWNPAIDKQAMGRIWRPVLVFYLFLASSPYYSYSCYRAKRDPWLSID